MSTKTRERPPVLGLYPPSSRPRLSVESLQDNSSDWESEEESGLSGYSSPGSDYVDDLPPWALFFYDGPEAEAHRFPLSGDPRRVNPHDFWPQLKPTAQLTGRQIQDLIERNPTVALRFWRRLYQERDPSDDNENFLCWRMAKFFSRVITGEEPSSKATSNLYCNLLAEGLYPFLEEMVSHPAFFRESPVRISSAICVIVIDKRWRPHRVALRLLCLGDNSRCRPNLSYPSLGDQTSPQGSCHSNPDTTRHCSSVQDRLGGPGCFGQRPR